MRTKLLAGVAMAALIGCTTLTMAQEGAKEGPGAGTMTPKGGPGGGAPGGAMHGPATPGGAAPSAAPGGAATPNGGGAAQNNSIPDKQGMGPPKGAAQNNAPKNGADKSAEEKNNGATQPGKGGPGAGENNAQNQHNGATDEHSAAQNEHNGGPKAGKPVTLSENQRTKIRDIVVKNHDVARVNSVNFNITVGAAVPRDVHFVVLPAEVVAVVPEYAGYDYIIVGDQLLIIDPNSLEIVAILPA